MSLGPGTLLLGGDFRIDSYIGRGAFGDVYAVTSRVTGEKLAAKIVSEGGSSEQHIKAEAYHLLHASECDRVPKIYAFMKDRSIGDRIVLVMTLFGKDLETRFQECGRVFSLKTILMLGIGMIEAIKQFHQKTGFIHRDLKPSNIVFGDDTAASSREMFLVDFGMCVSFRDKGGQHVKYSSGKKLVGTPRYDIWLMRGGGAMRRDDLITFRRYTSVNSHFGVSQTRRDDLESIAYVLFYFVLGGRLPWMGLRNARTLEQKYKMIGGIKLSITSEELCHGHVGVFASFLNYARRLTFEDEPNYDYAAGIFKREMDRLGYKDDRVYDWMVPVGRRLPTSEVVAFGTVAGEYPETPLLGHLNRRQRRALLDTDRKPPPLNPGGVYGQDQVSRKRIAESLPDPEPRESKIGGYESPVKRMK